MRKGYDVQYGARPMKRAVQSELEDVLTDFLLGETSGNADGELREITLVAEEDKIIAK